MAKSKEQKRQEALERQKERDIITAAQRLDYLDNKYGKDKGAQKERAKLKKLVENAPKLREEIEESIKKKFKVKKGQDPLKEKKKARRAAKQNK
jgi:phenylacetate-coenzyme A ligase PaaK-like adenylate-forming protein